MEFADIRFAPLIPLWAVLAMAGVAFLLTLLGLWRRAAGTLIRAGALAVAILALANPSWVLEEREPLPDVAVVAIDESASQKIGVRENRAEAAAAELERELARFRDLEVRTIRVPDDGGEAGTLLFEAIQKALSDVPARRHAGAILVTDGQVHDAPDGLAGSPTEAPVHVLLTGERGEGDRRLTVTSAPSYGIVGRQLSLELKVEDLGREGSVPVTVSIRKDDNPDPLLVRLPTGGDHTVPFTLDHGGPTVLEIAVEAGPAELTLKNNRAVVVVNGVRDRLRVLLVSGEPHIGERSWRNLLKADPSVDLVHFTILRPPEKQDGTPIRELSLIAFPIRELFELKLDEFDLIIFDRYRRRGVLPRAYLSNIVDYVTSGGAILEAAGPAFATQLSLYRTPLAEVLPGRPTGRVLEQPFRPELTALGHRHPVTGDLPGAGVEGEPSWGRWFRQIDAEATSGRTLMSGPDGRPLLIVDRVGEGRVAQLLSDHAWLWSRGYEGGGPQAEILRRVSHWLMKEPDLEEEVLRATVEGRRLTVQRRSLEPDPSPVTVTGPSGAVSTLTLEETGGGRAEGVITVDEPGLYRLDDGTRRAIAAVGSVNPKEYGDLRTSAAPLDPIREATGGGSYWLGEEGVPSVRRISAGRSSAGGSWMGLRANGDYIVTGLSQYPLLPPLALLLLVLCTQFLAWRREGK
ncbi:hypothetical protein [Oceanibacterium hippocampi]|uniref:Glutamine amidotransferase domain-containing protein n=1 Tax=Oceanibacterium hippocampi TaxID=745714 RepID=A0A1Y5S8I5_9PROT|nr:hypothetical protein [Oceanibacterium hippocampi]SLN34767.1 hypothetical protein OCH7691_01361 [Oceanibacterium hippocampi]